MDLNQPFGDTEDRTIKWNYYNFNGSGKISLFYDTDNQGFDGKLIVSDISVQNGVGTFSWLDPAITPGKYFVYAQAIDNQETVERAYSLGRISVNSTIKSPTNFLATVSDSGVVLKWQKPADEIIKGFSIKYLEIDKPGQIDIFTLGDTNEVYLKNLIQVKNYQFSIATVSPFDQLSEYVISNVVNYKRANSNSAPTITSKELNSLKGLTNLEIKFRVTAKDVDDDNLIYGFIEYPAGAKTDFLTGEVTWIPKNENIGSNRFKVSFADCKGGVDSLTFFIQIFPYRESIITFDRMIYSSDKSICVVTVNDLLFSLRYPYANTIGVTLETSQASFPIICKKLAFDVSIYNGTIDLKFLTLKTSDSIFVNYSNAIGELKRSKAEWVETIVNVENLPVELPTKFDLSQNYPNPFNPITTIKYSIPRASLVNIKIYDILGREVEKLVDEEKSPGQYQVLFSAKGLASGVYFYQIRAGNFILTKKLVLLK